MGSDSYIVLTQPSVEPITLTEVAPYLRVDFADDNQLISSLIQRARSFAETVTGRALAYQQVQEVFTIGRPEGGDLSGPISKGPSWYQYDQQIGANPFGASQFYYDLAMPPIDRVQQVLIETKVVAFDPWRVFPQFTNADGSTNTYVDYSQEPARLYIMSPITANFYRFTFWCGYNDAYPIPPDLKQAVCELVAHFYDYREGEDVPQWLMNKLLAKRIANAWI